MVAPPTPPFIGTNNFYSGGNLPIQFIVVHCTISPCTCGEATDIAHYFQRADTSAHYVVDSCQTRQCVHDWDRAWHCGSPGNDHSIGVELCAYVPPHGSWGDREHEAMLARAAKLTAQLCEAYDVPKRKIGPGQLAAGAEGVCGHRDVTRGLGGTTHTDPGSAFPWDHFMALVHGSTPEVDDVGHVDSISDKAARDIALALANLDAIEIPDELHAAHKGNTTWRVKLGLRGAWQQAYTGRRYAKANNGLLKNIAKQVGVDEQAIVAGVLEGLDPTAIAEAIPGDMAEQVVDILAQRLQS